MADTALIRPLTREPPHATGAALKKREKIESSWIFISASAFTLLQYVILVEVDEKNVSHRHIVGKEKEKNL